MSDAGAMVRDWVKSFDDKQREAIKKALKPEQWTQLESFEKSETAADHKAIKGFVDGIDAKQKGAIAGILKGPQLAELFKIGHAMKAVAKATPSAPKPFIIKK